MKYSYRGDIYQKSVYEKVKFDFSGLLVWIFSLVLSLLPIALAILERFNINQSIVKLDFLDCFISQDLLWTFSTLLLFSIINCFTNRKNKKQSLMICGLFVFALTEGLWLFCKYRVAVTEENLWYLSLIGAVVIISLLIATPLQINFLKRVTE